MSWIVLNSLTVFAIFQLLTFTEQKVVIAEDFENGEDETWLVDDENYDVPMDYIGDAPAGLTLQNEEKCPPLPEVLTSSACIATPCFSDSDCGDSEGRCCDNGCVFTCLSYPIGPTYVDWVREPRRQQRNGISWLIKGTTSADELEPCSTTPYEDEDPLLCPTGYICHVEQPGNSKLDLPNLGHCIPEKDVVFTDKTQTNRNMESICYLDKYVLTDGAKIKIENQTCHCKQGFLVCLDRDS